MHKNCNNCKNENNYNYCNNRKNHFSNAFSIKNAFENQLLEARSKLKKAIINDKDRVFQMNLRQAKSNLKSREVLHAKLSSFIGDFFCDNFFRDDNLLECFIGDGDFEKCLVFSLSVDWKHCQHIHKNALISILKFLRLNLLSIIYSFS